MPAHDRYLVTGVAGFIGSHLAEALLHQGHEVVGVDAFTENYGRPRKEANLSAVRGDPRFDFVEGNLLDVDLHWLLDGVDVVCHLAGEPGVRASWGDHFGPYLRNNIQATQRLLEAIRAAGGTRRLVYASSSSVYGDAPELPVSEETLPTPRSPYGVTKLAAEHLVSLYAREFGLPAVSLRFFTVYGPRQRPDMGFNRFIDALLSGREIVVFGDGQQTRDFTYVSDVVDAVVAAGRVDLTDGSASLYNIGGGTRVSLAAVISLLEQITERKARLQRRAAEPGDVRHTWADCKAARSDLGYAPKTDLRAGLAAQVAWQTGQQGALRAAA